MTKNQTSLFFIYLFLWFFGALALNAFEATFVGNTIEMSRGVNQTSFFTLLGDQEKSEDITLSLEPMFSTSRDLRSWAYLEKEKLRLNPGYQHRVIIFLKPTFSLEPGLYQAWIKVHSSQKTKTRVIRIPLSVQLQ